MCFRFFVIFFPFRWIPKKISNQFSSFFHFSPFPLLASCCWHAVFVEMRYRNEPTAKERIKMRRRSVILRNDSSRSICSRNVCGLDVEGEKNNKLIKTDCRVEIHSYIIEIIIYDNKNRKRSRALLFGRATAFNVHAHQLERHTRLPSA